MGGWVIWMHVCRGDGGVPCLMSCLQDLGASCRNMDREEEGHGVEQEAHSPHTMGEAAKGPAGVAGFLKEKSQNELLRGRLAF